MGRGRVDVGAGSLLVVCCGAAGLVGLRLAPAPVRVVARLASGGGRPLTLDDLVTAVCTGALVVALLWLACSTAMVAVAHLVRGLAPVSSTLVVAADRLELASPLVVRRVVGALLGLAVSAGAVSGAGTAYADPGLPGPRAHDTAPQARRSLEGLVLPARVTDADAPARPAAGPPPRPRAPTTVVVAPGDSLWSISSRLLGPGASGPQITAAWQRLHRANRPLLSADPDLIVPGTTLLVPDLPPTAPTRKVPPR